ncbi:hypothetical protein K1X76_10105 [bacterium]|nr:hypothetical protein [bacterium]
MHSATSKLLFKVKTKIEPMDFYHSELGIMPASENIQWFLGGICPFHSDQREGSFYVHLKSGAFNCFSCGTKGRDIIAFVKQRYNLDFSDAVQKLATEWRVQ